MLEHYCRPAWSGVKGAGIRGRPVVDGVTCSVGLGNQVEGREGGRPAGLSEWLIGELVLYCLVSPGSDQDVLPALYS